MKRDFELVMGYVRQLHAELMRMTPLIRDSLDGCDFPGVYVFTEDGHHLYVGRTRRVKGRLLEHSRPSNLDAPFAFRLAREITGNRKASYRREKSRRELLKDPAFAAEFERQKERIARMSIRYVRADDSTTQALLEIYISTLLDTPYNEFKTT